MISGGLEDLDPVRSAAAVEALRRRAGKATNNSDMLAAAVGVDARSIERWMERPDWELAVLGQMQELREADRREGRIPPSDFVLYRGEVVRREDLRRRKDRADS
jgi:hypothetical protein